ncbi:MAG TPA: hypothetical protein VFH68_07965 [Polyangia bacterium]|nr:hypothetical protein [Polyangia bacterium]
MATQQRSPRSIPVATVENLIRFRILELPEGVRVVIASDWQREKRGETTSGIHWQVYSIDAARARAQLERKVSVESSAHDFDIGISDHTILWLIESNRHRPLEATLLRTQATSKGIIPVSEDGQTTAVELPEARQAEIKVGTPWHTMMAEREWLFSPRVRASHAGDWWVVCNSLDGKILRMRGPLPAVPDAGDRLHLWGEPKVPEWKEIGFGPPGLYPVAVEGRAALIVAFAQATLAHNLFWSLGNYNGHMPEGNPRGTLTIQRFGADAGTATLAALGPVSAFDLDQGPDGTLYLAAFHEVGPSTEVALLTSSDEGHTWRPLATLEAPRTVDQVAVRAARRGGAWIGFAFRDGETSVIKVATIDKGAAP